MSGNKEELIMQLYNSMTNDEFPDIKIESKSRFDQSTGTFYSSIQDLSEIQKARKYFENVYQKLESGSTVGEKQKAMYYYIAVEALKEIEYERNM